MGIWEINIIYLPQAKNYSQFFLKSVYFLLVYLEMKVSMANMTRGHLLGEFFLTFNLMPFSSDLV